MYLLVDGSNVAYSIYAAKMFPQLATHANKPTSISFGFINTLRSLIKKYNPESVMVAWDGTPEFRLSIYPDYKANRHKNSTPDEIELQKQYREQVGDLRKILPMMAIHQYYGREVEADDLIAILCDKYCPNVIVSEDHDFVQLLSPNTIMYRPVRKYTITLEFFLTEYGISPRQYLQTKILAGDNGSDNISGIFGVGEKTALKLIKTYGDISTIRKNTHNMRQKKIAERIDNSRDMIIRNYMLMDLRYSKTIVDKDVEAYKIHGRFDEQMLRSTFVKYEFRKYLNSWADFVSEFRRLN